MFKTRQSGVKQNRFYSLPAPTGGFNSEAPLFGMPEAYTTDCTNFFPRADGLAVRSGSLSYKTGMPNNPKSLHNYAALNGTESLWATTDTGIYDCTTAGPVGASVMALTNGKTISTQISTGAVSYLFLVNGSDTCKRYDGTTWTSIAAFGTASNLYDFINLYRQRLFFVKKDSLEIEYLAANAIAGVATNYPLGAVFKEGGKIISLVTWTIDAGTGPEDNLVVITSKGQAAIFNGNDPAVWVLRGIYRVGIPLGAKCAVPYGGDVLIITETGLVALSSLVQSTSIDRSRALTQNFRRQFNEYAQSFGTTFGWQVIIDPLAPFVMVNGPNPSGAVQAVMNSQTGAWALFTGLNACCWARKGDLLYFGHASTGTVYNLSPSVYTDAGTPFNATFTQAYSRLGEAGNKKIQEIKPYIYVPGTASYPFSSLAYTLGISYDLSVPMELSTPAGADNLSTYTDNATISSWQSVLDNYSMWKGLTVAITPQTAGLVYRGSDILYTVGGHF